MRAVVDTNILIDYLRGNELAREELSRYDEATVSVLTWMEILVGARDETEKRDLKDFLLRFEVAELSRGIALRAIDLRRAHRLRLPDAVIWGTARELGTLLVTRNTKDFSPKDPSIRVPYVLDPAGQP